jgi:hypothetical protein
MAEKIGIYENVVGWAESRVGLEEERGGDLRAAVC